MKRINGELAIYISCIFYALVPIAAKLGTTYFGGYFLAFARFIIGLILALILLKIMKKPFKVFNLKYLLLRGLFGSIAMVLFMLAVDLTSSGRAMLLTNTYPIFVAIYGYLFFKEEISYKSILSLLICFIGIFFIFYDKSNYPLIGDLLALISALFAGAAVQYLKKAREKNNPIIIYLFVCFWGILFTFISGSEIFNINIYSAIIIFVLGASALIGQMFMAYGFKFVTATKGSIISYLTIPLTIFLSYFLHEEFTSRFFMGAILIMIGLILNSWNKKIPLVLNKAKIRAK
jgi:drug/metabolite transporter (DMT)-like permease